MTLNQLQLLLSLHLLNLKGLGGRNHLFQGTVSAFTRRKRKITKDHSYEGHYSSHNLNWVPFLIPFIHLFSVDLIQDMEIVVSVITQDRTAAYSIYLHTSLVHYHLSHFVCSFLSKLKVSGLLNCVQLIEILLNLCTSHFILWKFCFKV